MGAFIVVLVSCKNNEEPSKMKELEWSQDFPHYNPMELSVAMKTIVLIRSSPKHNAVSPPPQCCSRWNLITISQLVSELFMFESVDARTDGRTLARVPYYKLTLSLRLWWAKNSVSFFVEQGREKNTSALKKSNRIWPSDIFLTE